MYVACADHLAIYKPISYFVQAQALRVAYRHLNLSNLLDALL